jgi:diguanylate cyclase (GGDEF)-like protein
MIVDLLSTIVMDHSPAHVLVAILVCVLGSFLSVRILQAFGRTGRAQKPYWAGLLSITAGGTIWTTHFVAMLGYRPDVPSGYSALHVGLSLFTMIVAVLFGGVVGTSRRWRRAPMIGGVIFGAGVAGMHYVGMKGFAVACGVVVDPYHVTLSVVLACLGGVATLQLTQSRSLQRPYLATGAMVGTVQLMHFLGMSGLRLDLSRSAALPAGYFNGDGLLLPTTLVVGLVLIVGLSSLQIDRLTVEESMVRLRRAAREDDLTGLHNRGGFQEMLAPLLGHEDRSVPLMVIALDLDNFKYVNEVHGHAAGDRVLCETADRLTAWLPPGGFAARTGGDEFHLALPGTFTPEMAVATGTGLIAALERPVLRGDRSISVCCSVGIILCPHQAATIEDLCAGAAIALDDAKRRGRSRASVFDSTMARDHRERRLLGDDLAKAIERRELELYYQPQASLPAGEVTGFEVLLRWRHPVRGFVPPDEFVPLAEERGLIVALGEWVLCEAVAEAARWTRAFRIAVNVAAPQFATGTLATIVRNALRETGLPAHRLELEITESTVIDDLPSVQRQVTELKQIGVSLAMDDYGTGYSALSTLLALPYDKIKFDKSFIQKIDSDQRMIEVLRSTIELGRKIGVVVLAEGVETEHQASVLQALGCDRIQGYFIGRPMPAGDTRARFELELSDVDRWDRDRDAESTRHETDYGSVVGL